MLLARLGKQAFSQDAGGSTTLRDGTPATANKTTHVFAF